ncbi:DUF4123 domain-containing protein [Glaciimonas sp. GG7]
MSYAVDPYHPALLRQIDATLASHINKHAALLTYLLIDGTFDDISSRELWEDSQKNQPDIVSLYDTTALAELEECSPFLLIANPERIAQLLQRSAGIPMLSLLQSPLSIHALQRHFAPFLQVRTPSDGLRFPLPFADTLCSEDILQSFDAEQRSAFCSGFTVWHLINREGTLTSITGTCVDAAAYVVGAVGEANAIDITDKQYARLIDCGEADYLQHHFTKTIPELVTQYRPSTLHTMITELLAAMNRRDIDHDAERRKLLIHALRMSDRGQALALLDAAQKYGADIALERIG